MAFLPPTDTFLAHQCYVIWRAFADTPAERAMGYHHGSKLIELAEVRRIVAVAMARMRSGVPIHTCLGVNILGAMGVGIYP